MRKLLLILLASCVAFGQNVTLQKTPGTNVLTASSNPLVVGNGQTVTIASGGSLILANGSTFTPASGSNLVTTDGSYANPSWITSLAWSKLTGVPSAGTVSSVALTAPVWLTVTGSPITTSGTLAITSATGQTANFVLATPNGSTGALSPRALVPADIPTLTLSKISDAGTAATKAIAFFQTPQTSAAGYGITNGANLDSWAARTQPTTDVFASGAAHLVLATPSGSSGVPSMRALVATDIPTLTLSKISDAGTAASHDTAYFQTPQTSVAAYGVTNGAAIDAMGANGGAFYQNAGNLNAGTIPAARINMATLTPVFANNTSKPTTAAGYGITNGANIDAWGEQPIPSGTLVDTDSAQTLTNKSIVATQLTGTINASRLPAFTGDVTTSAGSSVTSIPDGTVRLTQMANLAAYSLIGNNTSNALSPPLALNASQVKSMLAISYADVSGLGDSAPLDVGVTAGTVAAGNDPRFNSPIYSALGQIPYAGVGAVPTVLNGNTSATRKFLAQTGTGSASAAPAWVTVAPTDIPAPTPTTLGGVNSHAAVSHQFLTQVGTDGSITAAQPSASDLTNGVNGTGAVVLATGNAATATALQTARTINGVDFDGTAPITVTAAAGTLTGTTLASNVVASSLNSAAGGNFGSAAFLSSGDSLGEIPQFITSSTYSGYGLGIGTDTPLAPIHAKVHADLVGAVSANLSHNYYPAVFESEDAVIGLISRDEGGHGSGIDLMEVNNGTLVDKWWWGRDSSTIGNSGIEWTYGTPATYETNTQMMTMTKTGVLKFPQLGSTLSVGTYAANGTLTLAATSGTATILTKTNDGSDTERLSLGGGGQNTTARGAYINIMGNEYSGQEGDLSLLAGDSTSGVINFYTGTTVKRGYVSKTGDLTWINTTDATAAGAGSFTTAGGIYATKSIFTGKNIHTLINSTGVGLVTGNLASANYSALFESIDAEIALASTSNGTLGSGIDLLEVNAGVLADKWWVGRKTTTAPTPSQLVMTYGTNADYAANTEALVFSTVGALALPQSTSTLSIGTYLSTGTLTLNSGTTTSTITANTSDGTDTKRISIAGGGLNTTSRGAYINLMGNEFSGQEGDLSLLAGDSTSGAINFYTGATVKRVSISKTGGITLGPTGTSFTNVRRVAATLVGGSVVVSDTAITANSEIYVGMKTPGGTPGACYVSSKTASTGYTITSTSALDTSVVVVEIIEP